MPRPRKRKQQKIPDAFTPDGDTDFSKYKTPPCDGPDDPPIEIHHPRFTGCWIPRDAMEMFWKRKLNAREVMLLATIDSLVGKIGCYASNKYLGKLLKCGPKHIAYMIGTLRGLNLVRVVKFDGKRRFLDTKWHRADQGFRGDDD